VDDLIGATDSVAEGVDTAPALLALAHGIGVDMPLSETVVAVLNGMISPGEVASILMNRSPKSELDGLRV
jgi:glycerol-3-phosphate dehydrogenase (NAD(P)+)